MSPARSKRTAIPHRRSRAEIVQAACVAVGNRDRHRTPDLADAAGSGGTAGTGGYMNRQPRAGAVVIAALLLGGSVTWFILKGSQRAKDKAKVLLPSRSASCSSSRSWPASPGPAVWCSTAWRRLRSSRPRRRSRRPPPEHREPAEQREPVERPEQRARAAPRERPPRRRNRSDRRRDHHDAEHGHPDDPEPVSANERLRARFEAEHPFPLDDFQRQAIDALDAGRSVLVAAPTGIGQDPGGRVRDRGRARAGRQDLLHDAR